MRSKILNHRLLLPVLIFALIGTTTSAYAACPAMFVDPGYTILPDDDAQVFLMYSEADRMETLVLQPEFSGTATEFGMVMPFPNRPAINEAPESMFDTLLEYTTVTYFDFGVTVEDQSSFGGLSSGRDHITVIEEKDVGDFKTVLLTADTAESLTEWLDDNNFAFKSEDQDNFEYYVEKGGYYFVAMKVNMDEVDVDDQGRVNGTLKPIEFVFESEYPMLPLRIMAHDADPMSFTLYTLGTFPYYVPGVDLLFLDVIDNPAWSSDTDEERLGAEFSDRYEPLGKWLLRMNVLFDPREIETNLILERLGPLDRTASIRNLILESLERESIFVSFDLQLPTPIILNTHLLPTGNGIYPQHANHDVFIAREAASFRTQSDHGIPPQSIDCKPGMQLILKPGEHNTSKHGVDFHPSTTQLILKPSEYNTACVFESSVPHLIERGWQVSTMRADELNRLS